MMRVKANCGTAAGTNRSKRAYTFAEVLLATGILGFMAVSICVGCNAGFHMIQTTRENLRATQIMLQKVESIRLFTWSQVGDSTNYLKSTFTEVYDPAGVPNRASGAKYTGHVTASVPAVGELPEAYRTNMRTITVSVSWSSNNGNKTIVHKREMQTRVARNGMQNYIWGDL